MDHKVSKDMISSGMIPSGEKTQADLGRTQYGSAPSPSSLMDAYTSIYEHHKKDADGNTIPHEGEELNENLAGIAAKGLQMASRGARQVGKMAAQGSVKARQMQAQGGVKKAVGDKLQSAKKKTALTSGQKEALLGRTTAGKITRGVGALAAANVAGRMASGEKKNDGGYYYMQNFHYVPDGDTISEVHIKNVYFGAYDEKNGGIEKLRVAFQRDNIFTPTIYGGIMEKECSNLLKKFFKNKSDR